jgi:hypothetical protein
MPNGVNVMTRKETIRAQAELKDVRPMNEYQLKRKAEAEQLTAELEAICNELAGNWAVDYIVDNDWDYRIPMYIKDDTGRTLHVTALWNHKDRIEVQGAGWPKHVDTNGRTVMVTPRECWNPKECPPVTTFARSRPVKAIAKQIETKILPEYDRLMARLGEMAKSRQGYADESMNAGKCIAIACGDKYQPGHDTHYVRNMGGDTVRIEYRSPGSCVVDLPAAEMVEVIALIRKLRASKAK